MINTILLSRTLHPIKEEMIRIVYDYDSDYETDDMEIELFVASWVVHGEVHCLETLLRSTINDNVLRQSRCEYFCIFPAWVHLGLFVSHGQGFPVTKCFPDGNSLFQHNM